MVRRKLRWKAGGTSQAGFSNLSVAGKMRVQHYVIDSPMQRLHTTGLVDERLRSGRPSKLHLERTYTILVY
jgi:hypothetical protein